MESGQLLVLSEKWAGCIYNWNSFFYFLVSSNVIVADTKKSEQKKKGKKRERALLFHVRF